MNLLNSIKDTHLDSSEEEEAFFTLALGDADDEVLLLVVPLLLPFLFNVKNDVIFEVPYVWIGSEESEFIV